MKILYVLCILVPSLCAAFEYTVKFETDCDRDFFVSDLDVYTLKGDPNPNVVGGASACEKRFNSNSKFKIYIQSFNTEDCAVTLYFHENDPTLKNPKWQLSCNAPVGSTLQTTTGNLVVRLVKPSGSASSYRFTILLTTEKGQLPTNTVGETAGGGVSTVVAIGIGVGVAAFLIIIIAVVCFFVCRQVNEQKKERMQQLQPSVFTTPQSRRSNGGTKGNATGSYRGQRTGSPRNSSRQAQSRSQGFQNKAYSETSNPSTDFIESKKSYAIMTDSSIDGKSSIRMQDFSRHGSQRGRSGSVRREKSVTDDARSSVKFDLAEEEERKNIEQNKPRIKSASEFKTKQTEHSKWTNDETNNYKSKAVELKKRENDRRDNLRSASHTDKGKEKKSEKINSSTTEGKDYFRGYFRKEIERSDNVRRSRSRERSREYENSSSSHNSSNNNRYYHSDHRDYRDSSPHKNTNSPQRRRSRSASRSERDRYNRESDSDDFYRESKHRSRSIPRHTSSRSSRDSHRRSRGDYYDDYHSDRSSYRNDKRRHHGDDYQDRYRDNYRDRYRDDYRSDSSSHHRSDYRERHQRSNDQYRTDNYRPRSRSQSSDYSRRRSNSRSRYDR